MSLFENNLVQVTAVSNSAVAVMDTNSSNSKIPAGTILTGITFTNVGNATVYLGGSSVTTATGLPLAPGQQITFQNYNYTTGTASGTNSIYAISSSSGSTVQFGLATVFPVA